MLCILHENDKKNGKTETIIQFQIRNQKSDPYLFYMYKKIRVASHV